MTKSQFFLALALTPVAMCMTLTATLVVGVIFAWFSSNVWSLRQYIETQRTRQYHTMLAFAFAKNQIHVDECRRIGWFWRGALERLLIEGLLVPPVWGDVRTFNLTVKGYRQYADRAAEKFIKHHRSIARLLM